MKNNLIKFFEIIISFVLIAAMALTLSSCKNEEKKPDTSGSIVQNADMQSLGEGSKQFYFTVTDKDGKKTEFDIHTDEKTVGAALLKLKLIEGEDGQYGLYVKTVNGITADYDKDKTFWEFDINGKMAPSGADATDIKNGEHYEFKISK